MHARPHVRLVDLPAERTNVYLHNVDIPVVGAVPDLVHNLSFVDHLAGVAGEVREYGELPRGQGHLVPGAAAAVGFRVDLQITEMPHDLAVRTGPPDQCSQPGDENDEGERLCQVVVGAGVQPLSFVVLPVLRGEHQDRRPVAGCPQVRADLVAVEARHHHIQHDDVVGVLGREPDAFQAVAGSVHRATLRPEPLPQQLHQARVVVHQQYQHGARMLRWRGKPLKIIPATAVPGAAPGCAPACRVSGDHVKVYRAEAGRITVRRLPAGAQRTPFVVGSAGVPARGVAAAAKATAVAGSLPGCAGKAGGAPVPAPTGAVPSAGAAAPAK